MENTEKLEVKKIYYKTLTYLYNYCSELVDKIAEDFFDIQLTAAALKGCAESIVIEKDGGDMYKFFSDESEKLKSILNSIKGNIQNELKIQKEAFLRDGDKILKIELNADDYNWAKSVYDKLTMQIDFYFKGLLSITNIAASAMKIYSRMVSQTGKPDLKDQPEIDRWHSELSKEISEAMIIIKMIRSNLKKLKE